jgi:hypothetical protein
LYVLPQSNIYISYGFGKAMCAERKVLSLESAYAFQESYGSQKVRLKKERNHYEEQQPDQCSPGS